MNNRTNSELATRWLTDVEVAALLKLNPTTIRNWRVADRKAGRLWPQPGYGGLRWRTFGRTVRYWAEDVLAAAGAVAEARHDR